LKPGCRNGKKVQSLRQSGISLWVKSKFRTIVTKKASHNDTCLWLTAQMHWQNQRQSF
jgi:hypothetical protein